MSDLEVRCLYRVCSIRTILMYGKKEIVGVAQNERTDNHHM